MFLVLKEELMPYMLTDEFDHQSTPSSLTLSPVCVCVCVCVHVCVCACVCVFIYISHIHVVQSRVTSYAAALLPLTDYDPHIVMKAAMLRVQIDDMLEGLHVGCSAFPLQ